MICVAEDRVGLGGVKLVCEVGYDFKTLSVCDV